jgi:hypothetical protein
VEASAVVAVSGEERLTERMEVSGAVPVSLVLVAVVRLVVSVLVAASAPAFSSVIAREDASVPVAVSERVWVTAREEVSSPLVGSVGV